MPEDRDLRSGMVLSAAEPWLGSLDRPSEAIESLKKAGLQITTTRKRVTDAADQKHNDLEWKLSS